MPFPNRGGAPVKITGGQGVGATNTAVASAGWTFTTGQWYYDGVAISGQTSLTYGPRLAADIGKRLTFVPTGLPYRADAGITAATVPDAPTIGTATAGNGQAGVAFTAPANNGGSAITNYLMYANGSDGSVLGPQTATVSPMFFTGLTNGVSYTFRVLAVNSVGPGPLSAASNAVTPSSFVSEATALFARMTNQPDTTRKNLINDMIVSLKSAGVWSLLDCLYVFGAADQQAANLNWIQNLYNATPTSSPLFGADVGYKGNGINNWVDLGFNAVAAAATAKFTQNSASFGCWSLDGINAGNIMGCYNGTNGSQIVARRDSDFKVQYRINQTAATIPAPNSAIGAGLYAVNRTDANNTQMYQAGSLFASATVVSGALVNANFGIGRLGAASTVYGVGAVSIAFIGASLTAQQHSDMTAAFTAYMNGLQAITLSANLATTDQTFLGGYIEIQPDSYNGGTSTPATDGTTDLWGFPYSLTAPEQARAKSLIMPGGGKGIQFLRLPLGFAYRGFRNIDGTSGLAKNIGERFSGQNTALNSLIANVVASGGGLAPEYWAPPPHWLTNGAYGGTSSNINQLWAGGSYARTVTLNSIRTSDATQYAAQISAFTDAIVNDLEYIHANVGPVRMYALQNEPEIGSAEYGSCVYSDVMYSDVLASLEPKVRASSALATYGGVANSPKLHMNSGDTTFGSAYKTANEARVTAGFTYHHIIPIYTDADYIKSVPGMRTSATPVWANEVEYFSTAASAQFRCANNMLRDLNNLVYGSAPYSMPIIHMFKQLGQNTANSNTDGYGLMKSRLPAPYGQAPSTPGDPDPTINYGEFAPVSANYNSYLLLAENLPVGAVRVGGAPVLPTGVGFAAFTSGGKLIVFAANRTANAKTITLPLSGTKTFNGKRYDSVTASAGLGVQAGAALVLNIPAYSGEAWLEQ